LPRKLGIKTGHRVLLDSPPPGFETDLLVPLPPGVVLSRRPGKVPYDVVVAFRSDAATYLRHLERDIARIAVDGSLWIAWRKKASGEQSDLTDNVVRGAALAAGVVDVKVCAVDPTWSALKLVHRLQDR
jgi:hypothetical protein